MSRINNETHVRKVSIETIIHVRSFFGDGTQENVAREIDEYFFPDGKLLVRIDNWKEEKAMETRMAEMAKVYVRE
jgi:hypothetical protein